MRRVTLDQAAKRFTPGSLIRIPPGGEFLWEAFWRIEQSRQTGMAIQPFTYQEIRAFADLSGTMLRPWEVEAIMAMDVARRNAIVDTTIDASKPAEPKMRRSVSARNGAAVMSMIDGWGKVRDE